MFIYSGRFPRDTLLLNDSPDPVPTNELPLFCQIVHGYVLDLDSFPIHSRVGHGQVKIYKNCPLLPSFSKGDDAGLHLVFGGCLDLQQAFVWRAKK